MEGKLKNQLDFQMSQLESIPRTEAASKRTTLAKLQKDFERIKVNVQAISSESALIKVTREAGGESERFNRTGNGSSGKSNNFDANDQYMSGGNQSIRDLPAPPLHQTQQQMTLKPVLSGREVDDAIMEERERDILKMNQDLALVNEMFKYDIHIVPILFES